MAESEFEAHCEELFRYFDRGQSFGLVIDVRESAPLSAAQRRIVAEKVDSLVAKHPDVRMVCAIIVASAVHRGVVKAITWLTRQPFPMDVFATVGEGVAWAQRVLASVTTREQTASPRSKSS